MTPLILQRQTLMRRWVSQRPRSSHFCSLPLYLSTSNPFSLPLLHTYLHLHLPNQTCLPLSLPLPLPTTPTNTIHINPPLPERDEAEAIDTDNIMPGKRTRGAAKPSGTYREPGDEEGLPGPEDGTSSVR